MLAIIAALAAITLVTSARSPVSETAPIPVGLRSFFLAFALLVITCGIALLVRTAGILPWELGEQTSLLIGWIFVGLSAEYAYVALRGTLSDARVLLVGFLVYAVVFIPPLLRHFWTVDADYFLSLIVNVGVLVLSAPLASHYLRIARVHKRR